MVKLLRILLATIFLIAFALSTAVAQTAIDRDLLVGKWKFVKTTIGSNERETAYNGEPELTFGADGSWVTEDTNPDYRQRGSWRIEQNLLIREAVESGMTQKVPFTYSRVIGKLTPTELVFYAATAAGARTMAFHFTRVE